MRQWLWLNDNVLERELVRILPFLAKHHRSKITEAGNLPIDVQHFRLQESDNVLGCYGTV
jgi:hypothetical protein